MKSQIYGASFSSVTDLRQIYVYGISVWKLCLDGKRRMLVMSWASYTTWLFIYGSTLSVDLLIVMMGYNYHIICIHYHL